MRTKRRKRKNTPVLWLWEFSKKVVTTAFLLYVSVTLYSLVGTYKAMLIVGDTTAMAAFITEMNETFRVVVGGYMLKAAGENVAKIVTAYLEKGKITETQEEIQY